MGSGERQKRLTAEHAEIAENSQGFHSAASAVSVISSQALKPDPTTNRPKLWRTSWRYASRLVIGPALSASPCGAPSATQRRERCPSGGRPSTPVSWPAGRPIRPHGESGPARPPGTCREPGDRVRRHVHLRHVLVDLRGDAHRPLPGASSGDGPETLTPSPARGRAILLQRVPDDDLLSPGRTRLSSALARFTVLFEMGRSGSTPLWSSDLTVDRGRRRSGMGRGPEAPHREARVGLRPHRDRLRGARLLLRLLRTPGRLDGRE